MCYWILEAKENEEDNCFTDSLHFTEPLKDSALARSESYLNRYQRLSARSKRKTSFPDTNLESLSPLSQESNFPFRNFCNGRSPFP